MSVPNRNPSRGCYAGGARNAFRIQGLKGKEESRSTRCARAKVAGRDIIEMVHTGLDYDGAVQRADAKRPCFGAKPVWIDGLVANCTSAMSSVPVIRRATPEDEQAATEILHEYYVEAEVIVRDDADAVRSYLYGPGAIWLAERDGLPIGCIALRPLTAIGTKAAEVKRLYVQQTYRRHGIADRLHEALERGARAAGYEWLYLDTSWRMRAAIGFYARHGYQPCEPYNTNPQATIFMRKSISPLGRADESRARS